MSPRNLVASAAAALLYLTSAQADIEASNPPATASAADTATEEAALASIRPEAIRADMRFLSSDLLEGRGTATRGHQIAASFMAAQFESLGLAPGGGSGTFLQEVPLQSIKVDASASSFIVSHTGPARTGQASGGQPQALKFREDYMLFSDPGRTDSEVDAPIVFVGFGITAPDQQYDDYRNVDVRGKIVAIVFGAPNFQSAVKAHYSASWLKRKNAAAHGAVGILIF